MRRVSPCPFAEQWRETVVNVSFKPVKSVGSGRPAAVLLKKKKQTKRDGPVLL